MIQRHITRISQALTRVFVQPSLNAPPTIATVRPSQFRGYQPLVQKTIRHASKYAEQSKSSHLKLASHPVNEDIGKPDKLVERVDEHGAVIETRELGYFLRRIQRPANFLVQVRARNYQEPGSLPQVKIMSEQELMEVARYQLRKARLMKANERRNVSKIVELSWVIEENDFAHRIKSIRTFMEDGMKVEVLVRGRKGMASVSHNDREAFLQRVKDRIQDVEGFREFRQMDGKMDRSVTLFFDSPVIAKKISEQEDLASKDKEPNELRKLSGYKAKLAQRERENAEEEQVMEFRPRAESHPVSKYQELYRDMSRGMSDRQHSGSYGVSSMPRRRQQW